jgi:hypothetical protein
LRLYYFPATYFYKLSCPRHSFACVSLIYVHNDLAVLERFVLEELLEPVVGPSQQVAFYAAFCGLLKPSQMFQMSGVG